MGYQINTPSEEQTERYMKNAALHEYVCVLCGKKMRRNKLAFISIAGTRIKDGEWTLLDADNINYDAIHTVGSECSKKIPTDYVFKKHPGY